jgi:hypothetical protein
MAIDHGLARPGKVGHSYEHRLVACSLPGNPQVESSAKEW